MTSSAQSKDDLLERRQGQLARRLLGELLGGQTTDASDLPDTDLPLDDASMLKLSSQEIEQGRIARLWALKCIGMEPAKKKQKITLARHRYSSFIGDDLKRIYTIDCTDVMDLQASSEFKNAFIASTRSLKRLSIEIRKNNDIPLPPLLNLADTTYLGTSTPQDLLRIDNIPLPCRLTLFVVGTTTLCHSTLTTSVRKMAELTSGSDDEDQEEDDLIATADYMEVYTLESTLCVISSLCFLHSDDTLLVIPNPLFVTSADVQTTTFQHGIERSCMAYRLPSDSPIRRVISIIVIKGRVEVIELDTAKQRGIWHGTAVERSVARAVLKMMLEVIMPYQVVTQWTFEQNHHLPSPLHISPGNACHLAISTLLFHSLLLSSSSHNPLPVDSFDDLTRDDSQRTWSALLATLLPRYLKFVHELIGHLTVVDEEIKRILDADMERS